MSSRDQCKSAGRRPPFRGSQKNDYLLSVGGTNGTTVDVQNFSFDEAMDVIGATEASCPFRRLPPPRLNHHMPQHSSACHLQHRSRSYRESPPSPQGKTLELVFERQVMSTADGQESMISSYWDQKRKVRGPTWTPSDAPRSSADLRSPSPLHDAPPCAFSLSAAQRIGAAPAKSSFLLSFHSVRFPPVLSQEKELGAKRPMRRSGGLVPKEIALGKSAVMGALAAPAAAHRHLCHRRRRRSLSHLLHAALRAAQSSSDPIPSRTTCLVPSE